MNILVTGGAGYIGSVLVPTFLAAGHCVHVLDDLRYGQELALATCCANPDFAFTPGDVRNGNVLYPLVEWSGAVIPLAAMVGAPLCARKVDKAWDVNYTAIHQLRALAKDKPIIYPNTNSGYGAPRDEATEDSPMAPISVYAETKCAAEAEVLAANGVALRLATVFGMSPRMRTDLLVNDFVRRAIQDRSLTLYEGHHVRNCVHVRDVVRAFLHALDHVDEMKGRAFNVVLENVTKIGICDRIREHVPGFTYHEAAAGRDPDQRDCAVSSARLLATGFRYEHGLDDGIDELVKGYSMMRTNRYGNV